MKSLCVQEETFVSTPDHWLPAQCSNEITCAPRVGVQRHIMARHFSCLLKPWKITKPGRITSGSHLLTTRVNPSGEVAWKELKPTLFALSISRCSCLRGEITVSKPRGNRLNADSKSVTVPGIFVALLNHTESNQVGRHLPSSTFSSWFSERIKKEICDVAHRASPSKSPTSRKPGLKLGNKRWEKSTTCILWMIYSNCVL